MRPSHRLLMNLLKVWTLDLFLQIFQLFFSFCFFSLFLQFFSLFLYYFEFSPNFSDISAKRLDLTGFVEALGPFLTSTDVDVRAKTMRLLSATMSNLSTDFLNQVQLNFITTFYCDRLKDHHSVVPSTLSGVEALVKMSNLPDECATRLLQAMFQNVPCQSQVRDDRKKIFNIISELCTTKTKGLTFSAIFLP